jgi:Lhr-like helicase
MTFVRKEGILTATKRKCSVCGAWKVHAEYDPRRGACKECRRVDCRKRYRNLPEDKLQRVLDMAAKRRKRRIRGETANRMAEAKGAIKIFRSHGMSLTDMEKLTGVMRDHIGAIEKGQRKYVHTATIEKFYEGVAFLAGVGK